MILLIHINVAGALDPQHNIHPRYHREADQQIRLKIGFRVREV